MATVDIKCWRYNIISKLVHTGVHFGIAYELQSLPALRFWKLTRNHNTLFFLSTNSTGAAHSICTCFIISEKIILCFSASFNCLTSFCPDVLYSWLIGICLELDLSDTLQLLCYLSFHITCFWNQPASFNKFVNMVQKWFWYIYFLSSVIHELVSSLMFCSPAHFY